MVTETSDLVDRLQALAAAADIEAAALGTEFAKGAIGYDQLVAQSSAIARKGIAIFDDLRRLVPDTPSTHDRTPARAAPPFFRPQRVPPPGFKDRVTMLGSRSLHFISALRASRRVVDPPVLPAPAVGAPNHRPVDLRNPPPYVRPRQLGPN